LAKGARTEEDEKCFYDALASRGVKVAYGTGHRGVENCFGWCRIRFSVREEVMCDAVQRIERFLEKRG
jgi:aspartate/methionine/tyrosine aminotransferase